MPNPPLPPGYELDSENPPLPPGYQLDQPNLSLGKTEIKADSPGSQFLRQTLSLIPAGGMMAGGAIGATAGPEGVPLGAGVGGMAGEGVRQLLQHLIYGNGPQSSTEAINKIAEQGELGMVSELGGMALGKLAPIFQRGASQQMETALAPTGIVDKLKAQQVAPILVQRGVVAPSAAGLEAKLAGETQVAGSAVRDVEDKILADAASQFPQRPPLLASDIKDSLLKYRNSMMVPGGAGIAANDSGVSAIDAQIKKLDDLVQKQGANLSPESVIGLRRSLDKQVTQAKSGAFVGADPAIGSMIDAKQEFANAIRRTLNDANPDLAKVNAEFSFWKTAMDVMHDTNVRKIAQEAPITQGLRFARATAIGGAVGYATHNPVEGLVTGLAMDGLGRAMRSTAWKTVSAVTKGKIADALASGIPSKVITLTSQIIGRPQLGITGQELKDYGEQGYQQARKSIGGNQ